MLYHIAERAATQGRPYNKSRPFIFVGEHIARQQAGYMTQ